MIQIEDRGRRALLLFIHGFMGGRESFSNSKSEMLGKLICADDWIDKNFDIGTYEYYSAVFQPSLFQRAISLVRRSTDPLKSVVAVEKISRHLHAEIDSIDSRYEQIILICHSMGGLVAKQLLVQSSIQERARIRSLLTLGTPHNGVTSSVLPPIAKFLRNPQLLNLAAYNQWLTDLNEEWDKIRDSVEHTFFYGLYDQVVSEASAFSEEESANSVPLEQDHISICKADSPEDEVVRRITKSVYESCEKPHCIGLDSNAMNIIVREMLKVRESNDELALGESPEVMVMSADQVASFPDKVADLRAKQEGSLFRVELFVNDSLSDAVSLELFRAAASLQVALIVRDVVYITSFLSDHIDIAIRNDLVLRTASTVICAKDTVDASVNSIEGHRFVNRVAELRRLSSYLRGDEYRIAEVSGLAGIGKSVLATRACSIDSSSFECTGSLRCSRELTDGDVFRFFHILLKSVGIHSFDKFFGNSHFSDEDRIGALTSILRERSIAVVIDNAEDVMASDRQFRVKSLAEITNPNLYSGSKSRLIITTRVPLAQGREGEQCWLRILVDPLNEDVVESEFLPSRLHLRSHYNESTIEERKEIHRITGGIPLLMDLMNSFLASESAEHSHEQSQEKMRDYLIESIVNCQTRQVQFLARLIALDGSAITHEMLRVFGASTSDTQALIDSGLVTYEQTRGSYVMHGVIQDAIIHRTDSADRDDAHDKLASHYAQCKEFLHIDDKRRHFEERRCLEHLIAGNKWEAANRQLAKISTRMISFNDSEELRCWYQEIAPHAHSDHDKVWLAHVEGHLADFQRQFDYTFEVYKEMVNLAQNTNDEKLIGTSFSHLGSAYRRRGEFESAFRYYRRALRISKKLNDGKLEGTVLNNMGQAYFYREEWKSCLRALNRAIFVRTRARDEFRLAATLFHRGSAYLEASMAELTPSSLPPELLSFDQSELRAAALRDFMQSINLQHSQENHWLLDRTYSRMAEYWRCQGNQAQESRYRDLAREVRDSSIGRSTFAYY